MSYSRLNKISSTISFEVSGFKKAKRNTGLPLTKEGTTKQTCFLSCSVDQFLYSSHPQLSRSKATTESVGSINKDK